MLVIELEPVTSKRDVAVPSAPRGEPNFIHYSVGISRTSPQSCSRKQYKETEGTVVGESNFARHPLPLYNIRFTFLCGVRRRYLIFDITRLYTRTLISRTDLNLNTIFVNTHFARSFSCLGISNRMRKHSLRFV